MLFSAEYLITKISGDRVDKLSCKLRYYLEVTKEMFLLPSLSSHGIAFVKVQVASQLST